MTKPAGVFLQLVGVPFVFYGFFGIFGSGPHAWTSLVIGLGLLYLGGIPSRKRKHQHA